MGIGEGLGASGAPGCSTTGDPCVMSFEGLSNISSSSRVVSSENLERAAAVLEALITHVGLLGCFPSPMGDPQFRGEVWVDLQEGLMGSGSFDFLTFGTNGAGGHESLCRACVVQEDSVLAG